MIALTSASVCIFVPVRHSLAKRSLVRRNLVLRCAGTAFTVDRICLCSWQALKLLNWRAAHGPL